MIKFAFLFLSFLVLAIPEKLMSHELGFLIWSIFISGYIICWQLESLVDSIKEKD